MRSPHSPSPGRARSALATRNFGVGGWHTERGEDA